MRSCPHNVSRRRLLSACLGALLLCCGGPFLSGGPARPGSFPYVQPDGTTVLLERHGDEFYHWTTLSGSDQVVELDANGFWRPASKDPAAMERAMQRRRAINQRRALRGYERPENRGVRPIPVILVEFSDVKFKIADPTTRFDAMLNEQGYSRDGATGSVRDYYYDNSDGTFTPVFEVFGPVTLSKKMSHYGSRDDDAVLAVQEGCTLLDGEIDFSRYDSNGDGYVDMLLMYYAGYNEAEGASASTIWPHQWELTDAGIYLKLDGKQIDSYFCTSELQGTSGARMCAIGSTCHEFAHSLGLPDFYDTDYEKHGECGGLYEFSNMCSGCYNNSSRTPPWFNAIERTFLGWMTDSDIPELPSGSVEIPPVHKSIAYQSQTDVEGEFFVYECRDGSGWDAPLPQGMLVYHADRSKALLLGGVTPYEHWYNWHDYNMINAYGNHPCFYIVPAADQSSLMYYAYNRSDFMFPGSKKVTTYEPVDWNGNQTGTLLRSISWSKEQGVVTLEAVNPESMILSGRVTDRSGNAIAGAVVVVSEIDGSAPRRDGYRRGDGSLLRALSPAPSAPVTLRAETDADGNYRIDYSGISATQIHVSVSCEGYVGQGQDATVHRRGMTMDFTLKKLGEASLTHFRKYDPNAKMHLAGNASGMGSVRYTAQELAPYAGEQLMEAAFFVYPTGADAVYIVVDFGDERALTYQIPSPTFNDYDVYDLSHLGIRIPEGKDMHIGYGFVNADVSRPLVIAEGAGTLETATFSMDWTAWNPVSDYDLVLDFSLLEPGGGGGTLATMGFASIDPGDGTPYKAGSSFPLRVLSPAGDEPSAVSWRFDGEAVSGSAVTLAAGRHTVEAQLTYPDGRGEILELQLDVQ